MRYLKLKGAKYTYFTPFSLKHLLRQEIPGRSTKTCLQIFLQIKIRIDFFNWDDFKGGVNKINSNVGKIVS